MPFSAALRACVLLVLSALGLGAGTPALAQVVMTPQEQADIDLGTYFYRDPRPERLAEFLQRLADKPRDWSAYPPLVGLLAVVFRAHGDAIGKLTPENLTPKIADTIAAALRLSGQEAVPQSVRDRLTRAGSDLMLEAQLADLPPRLEDLRITTPTHLDILWGAFFGSGSKRYLSMIIDYFAATANQSEAVALDLTQTAVAISGGPRTILGQLKAKHGDVLAYRIIVAATAEWGLWSNARQHPIVREVVTAYIAEKRNSFAAKSLSVGLRTP